MPEANSQRRQITIEEWKAEGERRFGKDMKTWPFVCPRCKTVQTAQDFIDSKIPADVIERQIAFSCIGRHTHGHRGCDWTLGGLFQIHELEIEYPDGSKRPTFEFAEVAGE